MKDALREIAATCHSVVEKRLFAEYGAIFVTRATPPPVIQFADAIEVETFQSALPISRAKLGEYEIELQTEAMTALLAAAAEAYGSGLSLTPRAADSARRTYPETAALWSRNVSRGLQHWQQEGRIDEERSKSIQLLDPVAQVAVILEIEAQEELFFGTYFNRSILYSVAAPGASQHLAMLAFDVAQYQDERVEAILNGYGWHRTVVHDVPHFTYLGYGKEALPQLGLKQVAKDYGEQRFRYWIADIS